MKIPETYIPVQIKEKKLNKDIGNGYFIKGISRLFLLHPAYPVEYTLNEIKELFNLFNPEDGIQFDINKLNDPSI